MPTRPPAAINASATFGGSSTTCLNAASRPPGRSTHAALAAPATGSTQCRPPPVRRSDRRPPEPAAVHMMATSVIAPLSATRVHDPAPAGGTASPLRADSRRGHEHA
jgi:hypothetical protein